MTNPNSNRQLHVVYVTSNADKAHRFTRLLNHTHWDGQIAATVTDARRLADLAVDHGSEERAVFICDESLSDGAWTDVLAALRRPLILVTDRLNLTLWKDAMAHGAADVIDTTFDLREVVQAVSVAWLYQRYQQYQLQLVPA